MYNMVDLCLCNSFYNLSGYYKKKYNSLWRPFARLVKPYYYGTFIFYGLAIKKSAGR